MLHKCLCPLLFCLNLFLGILSAAVLSCRSGLSSLGLSGSVAGESPLRVLGPCVVFGGVRVKACIYSFSDIVLRNQRPSICVVSVVLRANGTDADSGIGLEVLGTLPSTA